MTDEELRALTIEDLVSHFGTQCYRYGDTLHCPHMFSRDLIKENMGRLSDEIIRRGKNDSV